VSARGTLDRAAVSRALLQLRNTKDRDTNLSPAKALYGRELRDFLTRPGSALMDEMWMNLADAREQALGRSAANAEQWSEHTRTLPPLKWETQLWFKTKQTITPCVGTRGGPLSSARGSTSTR
jgi:hypothetical protein